MLEVLQAVHTRADFLLKLGRIHSVLQVKIFMGLCHNDICKKWTWSVGAAVWITCEVIEPTEQLLPATEELTPISGRRGL